jgi:hypothetical protein
MRRPCFSFLRYPFLFSLALLAGCAAQPEQPAVQRPLMPDFSGAWEVDYSQSENVRDAFDTLINALQRQVQRQSRNMAQGGGTLAVAGAGANSDASLYALARMAEIVTEPQLLDISQSATRITVKREGSFALECEFQQGGLQRRESVLGSEFCGWDGHQILFQVSLPDGLTIYHRFTLGPDGERINVATTLRSTQVSWPFTLDRVYRRYDPGAGGIRCQQTLSKGRVCTTEELP